MSASFRGEYCALLVSCLISIVPSNQLDTPGKFYSSLCFEEAVPQHAGVDKSVVAYLKVHWVYVKAYLRWACCELPYAKANHNVSICTELESLKAWRKATTVPASVELTRLRKCLGPYFKSQLFWVMRKGDKKRLLSSFLSLMHYT